ncbi:MAG: hypothetical protein MUE83_05905 [Tabrizicola sp.]|nr:hypothetical protein [Tabrizicola sp.]
MSPEVSMATPVRLTRLKDLGAGLCIMAFPLMLLFGFVSHPNILSLAIVPDYANWAAEWRGSFMFHLGHLFVMLAVPLIIAACIRLMAMLDGPRAWYGFFGGILGVFGAFMLAVDKGALTFVLTAFRALPEAEFRASTPAIQAIFERGGWLWITWGFVALPIGFIVLAVGLIRQGAVPTWQGICMIVGLLLLLNPDIEIISTAGALLMCLGFIPLGARIAASRD